MNTLLTDSIDIAAEFLKQGEVVAIPTETVYGLAANALDSNAVKKIYVAKGRPSDNPLIVHISEISEIYSLISDFPRNAKQLANHFWPGPLTMIFNKSNTIPFVTSGGLNTVAIRIPESEIARNLIKKLQFPLAAPSANSSGLPSPTSYMHVLNDLNGKIPAILKGPCCSVGVESTVIDITSKPIRLLRPGKISAQEISDVLNEFVIIDESVDHLISNFSDVKSPGIKYKHYSPRTKVILIRSSTDKFAKFVNSHKCVAMGFAEDEKYINSDFISYGSEFSQDEQINLLFDSLRKIDDFNRNIAYIHIARKENLNLAVLNRLLRASGFCIYDL